MLENGIGHEVMRWSRVVADRTVGKVGLLEISWWPAATQYFVRFWREMIP